MQTNPTHTSLVAVGDSFTEGMSDLLPDGTYRGWADLLASRMAAVAPGFRYANLAVRGKLIRQIVDEQVDTAAAMRADVVTLVGGLNDTLRPKCDMVMVRDLLTEAVERLAPHCRQLVLMRSPARQGPVQERFRPRMEALFTCIDELAERHGALVVDLYGAPSLGDQRLWDVDRLHLTADGHRRVAEAVWQSLGYPPEDPEWQLPRRPRCRRAGRHGAPRTPGSPGSTCCRGSAAASPAAPRATAVRPSAPNCCRTTSGDGGRPPPRPVASSTSPVAPTCRLSRAPPPGSPFP